MVRNTFTLNGKTVEFELTQQENNPFTFTFDFLHGVRGRSSFDGSEAVKITNTDLLNADYLPSSNVEDINLPLITRNRTYTRQVTMNPDSQFETWAIQGTSVGLFSGGEAGNYLIYFDLFRHALLLGSMPLIQIHGVSLYTSKARVTNTVIAHASTFYEHNSAANNREVVEIITGDGETHTGYGFNRPPERNGDDDRFNVPRPPSSSRLKSDHITYYTCLLYTSPSPRDS